ncbi:MAG: DUF1343 domain-containing protein [Bacteroidota bacterium]
MRIHHEYNHFPIGLTRLLSLFLGCLMIACSAANSSTQEGTDTPSDSLSEGRRVQEEDTGPGRVITGPEVFLRDNASQLQGKNVGVVANHTALLPGGEHLVDALIRNGVQVTKVFAPEHGFRGTADAGEKVADGVDQKTGLPIISLYGKSRKPNTEQMSGLEVVVFDIQDIGSRHYTYIGTMSYMMEACAEKGIPMWVLDRPNPNGWYVDGPVLEAGHESFIGMHHIPIVHGMTIAEYAQMVNQEGWLEEGVQVELAYALCEGYQHNMRWDATGLAWVPPSPNIGTEYAAYLYPALCWFEPTPVSLGRGTDDAFTMIGAPWFQLPQDAAARASTFMYGLDFQEKDFTPVSLPGKSKYPKFQDELCQGMTFTNRVSGKDLLLAGTAMMAYFYQLHQQKAVSGAYFKKGFHRWPGNESFKKQIQDGVATEDIYQSWQADVQEFKSVRKKYLLYEDFE